MAWTTASVTAAMTLDEVLARLATREIVDGIVVFGSAATGDATPTSDYDVLLVLKELPVPLRLVVTTVDGRLAEFMVTSTTAVDRLVTGEGEPSTSGGGWTEEALARFLDGRIVFDRSGRVRRAQDRSRRRPPSDAVDERDVYGRWFKASYSLWQTRRMLTAADAVSLMAVDLRLLYGVYDLWVHYFDVRGLPWRGDKEAIRYLKAHDPRFLDVMERCLAETDRERKLDLYGRLAELTMAPVGGIWPEDATVAQPDPAATWLAGIVERALRIWEDVIGGDDR